MKVKVLALLTVLALVGSVAGVCAQSTAEIYGKVTDASGAIMPGVTVTLSGPALLRPLVAVTTASGTYQFPRLAIGSYNVKFELAGFKTILKEGVRLEIGMNAQINMALQISTVQETITVTGETPLVDLKDTGRTSRFTQEALQNIPSARDPWVILEQSAGVAMDRQNVGGSMSGQQSNFVARGAAMSQQKWNLDGIDITDMSATGGSPVYFDFDAFEEMQISTGGADVSMQSPGVGINLVTKSGTDRLRGSGRVYITSDTFGSNNVTDAMRTQGVNTGNPIQNIKDYGFEIGGPIKKGRAWIWGSYGIQNIQVGINNFYKADANCQAMKATPLNYSLQEIWTCLNTDLTDLKTFNMKFALQTFKNNQFSFYMNSALKYRNARGASDLNPIETTARQLGVDRPDLGSWLWKTGTPKTYKFSDRHIFSDKFMMEFQYSHVGNNFALTFHEDSLRDVQPTYEITTQMNGRSGTESVYVRPTDSIDITGNYFLPSWLGGDNALKFGYKHRNDIAHSESMTGGDASARLQSGLPAQATLSRRSITEYGLQNRSFYAQDSYTRKKLTVNLGFRYDYQTDYANPASVPASPFFGMSTFAGDFTAAMATARAVSSTWVGTYTGTTFNQLPSATFGGAKAGLAFKNFSPRLGFTYDITGNGRNVAKLNYSRYASQIGTGSLSSTYNTVNTASVRYPWVDLNGDTVIQANEIVYSPSIVPLSRGGNYDWQNPSAQGSSPGKLDPNLTNDYTNEFIIGFDKAVGNDFAVSASYIWRKYENFRWSPPDGWSSANYVSATFTPAATACPAGARCPTVTYYEPTSVSPTPYTTKNQPDYWRGYNGFEVTARKRMTHNWTANASFSHNTVPVNYDSSAAYTDPTNISMYNGGEYAPESTSSGLGNVFVNAKWLFRMSGTYTTPFWGISVAGFYNSRSGYPFQATVYSPSRAYGAGQVDVLLDQWGSNRLPNFQTIDFRVDKSFTLAKRVKIVPSLDIFNLMNGSTAQSIRGRQNASNANTISSILAPRILRFGFRATW